MHYIDISRKICPTLAKYNCLACPKLEILINNKLCQGFKPWQSFSKEFPVSASYFDACYRYPLAPALSHVLYQRERVLKMRSNLGVLVTSIQLSGFAYRV